MPRPVVPSRPLRPPRCELDGTNCRLQVHQIAALLDADFDGTVSTEEVKSLFAKLAGTEVESIPDDHPGG